MPNTGVPEVDELLDLRHGVDAGRRRVAGAVRQEYAVGLPRENSSAVVVAGTTVTRATR